MDLMLRPDQDTFAETGSAAEWDERVKFRRLDSNQDNQDQNLMSCQLLHAGRRRVEDRRGVASTIPSHPQTLVPLQSVRKRSLAGMLLWCSAVGLGNAQGRACPAFDPPVQLRTLPEGDAEATVVAVAHVLAHGLLTRVPPPARAASETKDPGRPTYGPLWFMAGLPTAETGPDVRPGRGVMPRCQPAAECARSGGVDCAEVWTAVAACGARRRRPASR